MKFTKIDYRKLNARQKENFNFQKVSAVLADYGFVTLRLSDDWQGADFLAQHVSGFLLRVQLKSRLTFARKYEGKDLYICFGEGSDWFLYPHDELLKKLTETTGIHDSRSWKEDGLYSFPRVPQMIRSMLQEYQITGDAKAVDE